MAARRASGSRRGSGSSSARKKSAAKNASRNAAKRRSTAAARKRGSGKRELVEPNAGDKRYVRRTGGGRFTESQDDVGRSLSQDRKRKAKTTVKSGHGDEGDQKARSSTRKSSAKKSSGRKSTAKRKTTSR